MKFLIKEDTVVLKDFHKAKRSGGILLHISSLPSKYGIGDFGSNAYRFVDFLHKSKIRLWQILPLGPTNLGNSPYQCLSAFAGNPLLIDFDDLLSKGLITKNDIQNYPELPDEEVFFVQVIAEKDRMFRKCFSNSKNSFDKINDDFVIFKGKHQHWLDNYALFMSIREKNSFKKWSEWKEDYKLKRKSVINKWQKDNEYTIEYYKFVQFLFFEQWSRLKSYANGKNISIIGDLPVYVSFDSSDVWENPDLFFLNKNYNTKFVAGVPPDYFSDIGQKWGNPLYRWKKMKDNDFNWWKKRIEHSLKLYDFIRIDHFRGFADYWRVLASEPTAVKGRWVKGPGKIFFKKLIEQMGNLPILAEDLGIITPEVEELRDYFKFPGMRIMQFGFDNGDKNIHFPKNYPEHCVAYTGTHDNETLKGWLNNLSKTKLKLVTKSVGKTKDVLHSEMIKLLWSSRAKFAILPLQDILELGTEARMNTPGIMEDNWEWRFEWETITDKIIKNVEKLNKSFRR